ncbi:hypothetical protein GCM10027425_31420 [Alteromonas gracilis]
MHGSPTRDEWPPPSRSRAGPPAHVSDPPGTDMPSMRGRHAADKGVAQMLKFSVIVLPPAMKVTVPLRLSGTVFVLVQV